MWLGSPILQPNIMVKAELRSRITDTGKRALLIYKRDQVPGMSSVITAILPYYCRVEVIDVEHQSTEQAHQQLWHHSDLRLRQSRNWRIELVSAVSFASRKKRLASTLFRFLACDRPSRAGSKHSNLFLVVRFTKLWIQGKVLVRATVKSTRDCRRIAFNR